MFKKRKYLLVILVLLSFTRCAKDPVIRPESNCSTKQSPGEYFPAYPGSWWSYKSQNNETIKYKIKPNYVLWGGECASLFENLDKPILGPNIGHSYYCGLGAKCDFLSPIYSLEKDSVLECLVSFSTLKITSIGNAPYYRRKLIKKDTTLTVSNKKFQNVIVVKETSVKNVTHHFYDYFSKNIGLIKRDSVDASDSTKLITILRIENYQIVQ